MAEQGREVLAAAGQSVRSLCKRAWWVFLIGGIASVVFGVLAFINPGIALLVLGMFFAASILVDGAVNAWGALQNREKDGWWAILLIGLAGILVGGYALFNPPVSMMALIFLVAVMAVVIGIGLLALGYKIRAETEREWMLYLAGGLSLLLGILMFLKPGLGGVSLVYTIAFWAIVIGALRIVIALKVKNLPEKVGERVRGAAA
jgi:uncharacterized membrane protein HdeD (DUF308 family)